MVRNRIVNVVQEIAGGDSDAETGSIVTASSARQSGLHRYLRPGSRNARGYAPFAGNGSVSASRIGYRKRRSLHLSPRAVFGISFSRMLGVQSIFKHLRRRRRWGLEEKPEHEARRKIIREWMSLPKDKRQTEEQAKPFAKKAVERIPSSGDPYRQIMRWLLPRIGKP